MLDNAQRFAFINRKSTETIGVVRQQRRGPADFDQSVTGDSISRDASRRPAKEEGSTLRRRSGGIKEAFVAKDDDTVILNLAETGNELGPALEAAQYARIVQCPDNVSAPDAHAIARFLDAFTAHTGSLPRAERRARQAALARLSSHLVALEERQLFVHWAVVERELTAVARPTARMPLAVLNIDRSPAPTIHLRVPRTLRFDADDLPSHH